MALPVKEYHISRTANELMSKTCSVDCIYLGQIHGSHKQHVDSQNPVERGEIKAPYNLILGLKTKHPEPLLSHPFTNLVLMNRYKQNYMNLVDH